MKKIMAKPENIFLLLAPILIGLCIALMPIGKVPDEANHARMTWEILHEKEDKSFAWMKQGLEGLQNDRRLYNKAFTEKIDFSDEKMRFSFSVKKIMHLPQLVGMMIGKFIYPSLGVMIILGRIVNALFYIVLLYFIIKYMRYGKLALLFISLLPIMIQQAASLSYDVMNFVIIFGFFALLSNLSTEKILNKRNLLLLMVITIGLYASKVNNLLLLGLLLPLGLRLPEKFKRTNKCIDRIEIMTKKYKYVILVLGILLGCAFVIFYLKNKGGLTNFIQVMLNSLLDNNLNPHLNSILTVGMFGYIGLFDIQMPLWLIMIDLFVLSLLLVKNETVKLNKIFGVISGLMIPIQIAAIIAGMYFEWTPIALGENALISQGAQGRYFTPFLIYLIPLFISFKEKFTLKYEEKTLVRLTITIIMLNFTIMIYLMLLVYWYPAHEAEWLIHLRKIIGSGL